MGVFHSGRREAPRPEDGAGGEGSECWGNRNSGHGQRANRQQEVLQRTAEWINSSRYVPPSAVSNVMRDALLRAGLVNEATLRAHQIY